MHCHFQFQQIIMEIQLSWVNTLAATVTVTATATGANQLHTLIWKSKSNDVRCALSWSPGQVAVGPAGDSKEVLRIRMFLFI